MSGAEADGWRIRVARPSLPPLERYVEMLEGVWERGTLTNDGPAARELEKEFAAYGRLDRVLAASSGDVALTLALAALELPRGTEAVLPSFGYPSTVNAIEWNGLTPRFVDVDPDDWCLHAEQLDVELDNVSVIVATHMFGAPCDVAGLQALAGERGIALLYDAAQAVATWVGDHHVARFGDASVISLSATKVLTSAEGALVALPDADAADRFAQLRSYGMDRDGISRHRGLNAKLSELHAGLGLLSLAGLDEQLVRRRALIATYRSALEHRAEVRFQRTPAGATPTPGFAVADLGEHRDIVRAALAAEGIESRLYFPALHWMPRLAAVPHAPLPVTERLDRGLLALPLYAELEPSAVEGICAVVCRALEEPHTVDG